MIKAVLAVLLALPPWHQERTQPELDARGSLLAELAPAIIRESKGDSELAAMVIAIGWHETKFSVRLAASECRRRECDPRRFRLPDGTQVLRHQARGTFQLHQNRMPVAEWDALLGPASLNAQVKEATKRARSALYMCRAWKDREAAAFSFYGGLGCAKRLKDSSERVATMRRIRGRL